MQNLDLVLLHAPSVYDFRKMSIFYGPVTDIIPPSPVFENYPIGFLSLSSYLEKHGYRVRIANIALKMLMDEKFNVERFIKSLNPLAFGIDFHWTVHAHGSIELAKIVKKTHPNTPIIFGGLASTYFHIELLRENPFIDFVIRGDSGEVPLLRLMECIEKGKEPNEVPNLTWRNTSGRIKSNSLVYVPENLDDFFLDYELLVKSVFKYRDLVGHLPYLDWMKYPMACILSCKGCLFNCITCSGSKYAYEKLYQRKRLALKKPEILVKELSIIEQYMEAPVFIVGDLRMGGRKYAELVLKEIKKEKIKNQIIIELFYPSTESYIKEIAGCVQNFSFQISPESHNEEIRRLYGRTYGNFELEKTIKVALNLRSQRFDLFFTMGLPHQNKSSVIETVHYAESLLKRFGEKLRIFITPFAPFIDPGSIVFNHPKKYGYRIFFRRLKEFKDALASPTWKQALNYETIWMNRTDLTDSTYLASEMMIEAKKKLGIISEEEALKIKEKIKLSKSILNKVDEALQIKNEKARKKRLEELKTLIKERIEGILCTKEELMIWLPGKARIKRLRSLLAWLKGLL